MYKKLKNKYYINIIQHIIQFITHFSSYCILKMSSIYYQSYSKFLEIDDRYGKIDEKYIEIVDRHKEMSLLEAFIKFCLDDIIL